MRRWPNLSQTNASQQHESYLKDTTDFINLIEKNELRKGVILVSMDVTSLYTNIPQKGGINIVCTAYKTFYSDRLPIAKCLLEKAPRLVLQENSFHSTNETTCKHALYAEERREMTKQRTTGHEP